MIRVCVIRVRMVRVCMIRVCMLRWLYHAQKSSEPRTENQQTPTSMSSGVTTTTAMHLGGDGGFTPRCVTT